MSVQKQIQVKKINRSRKIGAAIEPCFQMLEKRTMMAANVPTLAFSAPAFYTGTVNPGGTSITLNVTRSIDTKDPVSVTYTTSDGTTNANALDATAVNGTDYSAETGTISFAAGQTSEGITIPILQPNTGVGDKVFSVTLSNPTNSGAITSGTAVVLINQTPRPFQAGDAVVEVGGNGATPLLGANGTNTIYLAEYNSSGRLVQSFPVPNNQTGSQTAGQNRPLMAGDSGFEGLIGNSIDGQNILLGGYDSTITNAYTFGYVTQNDTIDTQTGINSSVSLSVPRGLATTDNNIPNNIYWTSSSSTYGLQQIARDTQALASNAVNVHLGTPRALTMDANGDLFSDSTTSSTGYVDYIPTNGNQVTGLPGFTSSNAGACTQFAFASNVTEDDTIYLQDGGGPSSIEKFSLKGTNANGSPVTLAQQVAAIQGGATGSAIPGTWVLDSSTLLPANAEGLGLTVDQTSPTNVQIYDTLAPFSITGNSGTVSDLYSLTDTLNLTSPTPVSGTLATIASLPGNTGATGGGATTATAQFHCVAYAPVAAGVTETTVPQSQTASTGQTVTFTAWAGQQNEPSTALGTKVQWYSIDPGTGNVNTLAGQTSTTLKVTATDALNGEQYYAVFSNSYTGQSDGSENIATLTVNDNPYVTGVIPSAVTPSTGGNVNLSGGNFTPGSTVTIQGIASNIPATVAANGNSLTFTAPAGAAGTYDVQVTNSSGESPATSSQTLTYVTTPSISSISPATGADGGGTTVTITGNGFVNGATVSFGGVSATSVTFVSPTELIAVTPAATTATAAKTVDTVVTESVSGTSQSSGTGATADQFTYYKETVAQADLGTDNTAVLLDNNPVVTAITQHIGTFDGDTYSNEEFLLDDGTASIMVIASSSQLGSYVPTVGDVLKIAGQFTEDSFPLLPQLVNITSITKVSSGSALPANYDPTINVATANTNPIPVSNSTSGTFIPGIAAQVVTLSGATINGLDPTGDTFGAGNLTFNISDSSDPYVAANGTTPASGGMEFYYAPSQIGISVENLAGLSIPSGNNVTITGIIQNYYGVNEFCPISIPGNTENFVFTTSGSSLSSDKNANAVTDGFSSVTGSSFTVTVNRAESAGGAADTGTVNLVLTADNGTAGTNFNVSGFTPVNGTITIPVSFGPGVTSASYTVNTNASSGVNGSKLVTVSLSSPATNNAASPTNPSGFNVTITSNPQTVVIEDTTATQNDVFASVSLGSSVADMANIQANAVTGSDALNIESQASGQNADYGILTFDDSGLDPTDILNNPSNTLETINGLQFEALPTKHDFDANGTLNVYIITDTSHLLGSTQNTTFPTNNLSFSTTDSSNSDTSSDGVGGTLNPATGIISNAPGLGTLYPLGSIAYNTSTVVYGSENVFNLSTLNSIGTELLASDITQGTPFTIVIAPGDGNVAASFAGFVNGPLVQQTAPNIRIQYSTVLPSWVSTVPNNDANSPTVLITPTNTLSVTGTATITANPSSPSVPNVSVSGTGASLNISSPSAITAKTGVSLGGVSVSNGATVQIASLSSPQVIFVAAGSNSLSVDSTSTLNIGSNILDLKNGSTSATNPSLLSQVTGYVANGYNSGAWNGTTNGSIQSTAAAADPTRLSAVGVALGSQFGGTTLDGQTPGKYDVLVRETYYGDANLDGKVDGSDYSLVDSTYTMEHFVNGVAQKPVSGWANGDFNYDGVVDGSDYTLMDNAFNQQNSAFATPKAQIATPAAQIATVAGMKTKLSFASTVVSGVGSLATAGGTTSNNAASSSTALSTIEQLLQKDASNTLLAKDVLDNLHAG
jgi:hypothetical protein